MRVFRPPRWRTLRPTSRTRPPGVAAGRRSRARIAKNRQRGKIIGWDCGVRDRATTVPQDAERKPQGSRQLSTGGRAGELSKFGAGQIVFAEQPLERPPLLARDARREADV